MTDQLRAVIADEKYAQDTRRPGRFEARAIDSELLFFWVPEEQTWLTVRNVRSVDGHTIPDSKERIDRILSAPGSDMLARLRQLQMESSRFNLGDVARTLGYPTLALQFLLPSQQGRFRFEDDGAEKIDGVNVHRLAFVEMRRPTFIITNGRDSPVSGRIWIQPGDGAVRRTTVTLRVQPVGEAHLQVEFARDPRLNVWVPSKMTEKYLSAGGDINCTATYSNVRRFETSGRIVR